MSAGNDRSQSSDDDAFPMKSENAFDPMDVVRVVPGLMSYERRSLGTFSFMALLLAGVITVLTVGSLLVSRGNGGDGVITVTPTPTVTKTVYCDTASMLGYDLAVMDKAYSLAVTGKQQRALAEIGKHYRALYGRTCQ